MDNLIFNFQEIDKKYGIYLYWLLTNVEIKTRFCNYNIQFYSYSILSEHMNIIDKLNLKKILKKDITEYIDRLKTNGLPFFLGKFFKVKIKEIKPLSSDRILNCFYCDTLQEIFYNSYPYFKFMGEYI
jgi:hypothetical protein